MDIKSRLEMKAPEINKVDIYRDTPIRYLGYANELGEAFRAMIGAKWVVATYGVAMTYVIADTVDKTYETYTVNEKDPGLFGKTSFTAVDTLLWQTLASVAIPGFTINRVCAAAEHFLKRTEKLKPDRRTWVVTAIGLLTIPFIIKPIDNLTDKLLDGTLRKIKPE